jgi:hypothetical protein
VDRAIAPCIGSCLTGRESRTWKGKTRWRGKTRMNFEVPVIVVFGAAGERVISNGGLVEVM